jgi:hypothetical protein
MVKSFVKITQAKEKDCVWVLPFDIKVLLPDGG